MPNHFGLTTNEGKYGLKLTRENYAIISNKNSLPKFSVNIYADDEGKTYSDTWCQKQMDDCLKNFDLNMKFFSELDHTKFNEEINVFLQKNKNFREVFDLNLYYRKSGYYMLVLDEYCQVYIGTTQDIKARISQHWAKRKQFDRLLFPMGAVNTSLLSIDSFRAFDTTRIYALETLITYDHEDGYINQFSPEFASNRLAGGKVGKVGLLQAILMMKNRKLT